MIFNELRGDGSLRVPDITVFPDSDTLLLTRTKEVKRKDSDGKVVRTQRFTDAIVAKIDGDDMQLTLMHPHSDGKGMERSEFTGKRIDLPPILRTR